MTNNSDEEGRRRNEAVTMAIEALEKQIPKKPIEECDWRCPRCIHRIAYAGDIYRHCIKFCDRCGQAIDWSSYK